MTVLINPPGEQAVLENCLRNIFLASDAEGVSMMPTETFFNLPAEKREKIIQVALEEFAAHSYPQASVSRIVRRAGIAKGSIYQYFKDKRDLYLYLIQLAGEAKMHFIARQKAPTWENFFASFRDVMVAGAGFGLSEPRNQMFARMVAKVYTSPVKDEMLVKTKRMAEEYLAGLVRLGQEKGQVRDDLPLDLLVYFLHALTADLHLYLAKQAGVDPDALIEPQNWEKVRQRLDLQGILTDLVELMKNGMSKEVDFK